MHAKIQIYNMFKMPCGEIHHTACLAALTNAFYDYRFMMWLAKPVLQNLVYFSLKHVFQLTFYMNMHIFPLTFTIMTHIFLKKQSFNAIFAKKKR